MRRIVSISALTILLAVTLAVPASASTQTDDAISPELRAALKEPLKTRIKELLKQKDDLGSSYIYGSYYDSFTPVGDGYEVPFVTRTSNPAELVAERYTLTLKQEGGEWKIVDERSEHKVNGTMYRSIPRDETFYTFDSFSFDREGLKISGGAGDLIVDYRNGEPFRLWFQAEDMQYDYMTPVDLGWYGQVLKMQLKKFPKDIVFNPQRFTIYCTSGACEEFLSTMFAGKTDSSLEQLSNASRTYYDKYMRDLEKARKEFPLAGFRVANYRPSIETWSISVKKKGRDHYATLRYDNEGRQEMAFSVTALGDRKFYGFPMFVYNSEETRNSGIDPYELELRDDIYTDTEFRFTLDYDIIGLTGSVEMALTDDEMMSCDFTYELLAKRDFDWLPFYVAQGVRRPGQDDDPKKTPTLNVYEMEDGEGNTLTYIRGAKTFGLIVFPETVKAGEKFKLHVKFDNGGSIYKHNHTYSRVNRGGWAPFVTFSDNIDYLDLEISVDSKYRILGIDNKVSETVTGRVRTARYKSDFPLTFPTIIFGDYESRSSKIEAKKSDGTLIPVNVHVDKTSMRGFSRMSGPGDDRVINKLGAARGGEDADTQYDDLRRKAQADGALGVRDIRPDALSPIGDQAVNAINLYTEIFGVDYPFAKLDLVNDPLGSFYGQAPPSIVYLGYGVFYPTAKVNLAQNVGDISSFQNTVVAHELGHQWWGSAVVNPNQGNYWFVESLAEYSAALYSEATGRFGIKDPEKAAKKGWAAYMKDVEEWRRMLTTRPNLFTSVQHSDSMMPGIEPAARTAAIYNKGPYMFHMMRLLFGEEKFFKFLKDMAQKYEGKAMSTRDMQITAEQSLCGFDEQGNPCSFDLEWFFDQWIRGVGMPEYSFTYTYRQAEDGNWVVEGDIKQRVVLGADRVEMPGEVFRGRTKITVIDKAGKEYNVPVVIDAQVTPFAFKVPEEPFEVVMNKDGDMLGYDVHVNTTW